MTMLFIFAFIFIAVTFYICIVNSIRSEIYDLASQCGRHFSDIDIRLSAIECEISKTKFLKDDLEYLSKFNKLIIEINSNITTKINKDIATILMYLKTIQKEKEEELKFKNEEI